MKLIIISAMVIILAMSGGATQCSENFSPCSCTPFSVGVVNIDCYLVPVDDIKSTFESTTTTDLIRLVITLPLESTSTNIPADLLGNNMARDISLTCQSSIPELNIDANAFSTSKISTYSLNLRNCNLKQVDFSFLSGFEALYELIITDSTFPATLNTLPRLQSLYYLIISNSNGYQSWGKPDLTQVHELYLQNNFLNDDAAAEILNSISASPNNSLEVLQLSMNKLTRIPDAVHLFEHLTTVNFDGNVMPVIQSSSLAFVGSDVVLIRLEDLSLTKIEADAFQGQLGSTQVQLTNNNFARFDSDVFQSMLEDMKNGTGRVELYFNPIVCDCNIAWLIRDNRHLLPSILGGTCSNLIPFEDLNPDEYLDCDLTSTQSPSSTTEDNNSAYHFGPTIVSFLLIFTMFLY